MYCPQSKRKSSKSAFGGNYTMTLFVFNYCVGDFYCYSYLAIQEEFSTAVYIVSLQPVKHFSMFLILFSLTSQANQCWLSLFYPELYLVYYIVFVDIFITLSLF